MASLMEDAWPLIDTLGEIPDPRRGQCARHEFLDILSIALVASVCGAESCVDFAEFAEDRETLLREFLSLKNGLPSHDTFSRVFRLLDPAAFGRAFEAFLDDLGAAGDGVLAIDGKTLRRSFDRAAGRSALHVVTAFGSGARVAIAQRAVPEGENETLAARALLGTLALDGLLVTGDAMHAHEGTAAGHPRPRRRLPLRAQGQPPGDAARGRGLLRRSARSARRLRDHRRRPRPRRDPSPPGNPFHRLALLRPPLPGEPRLPGLATLACVEATRTEAGRTTTLHPLLSHSATLTPEAFARAVRGHWAIENSLHWVLDVTFDEDRARNRRDNGPENLAILRRLTLNLLNKARPKMSVARKRKRSGWSDAFARTIIGQMR